MTDLLAKFITHCREQVVASRSLANELRLIGFDESKIDELTTLTDDLEDYISDLINPSSTELNRADLLSSRLYEFASSIGRNLSN